MCQLTVDFVWVRFMMSENVIVQWRRNCNYWVFPAVLHADIAVHFLG